MAAATLSACFRLRICAAAAPDPSAPSQHGSSDSQSGKPRPGNWNGGKDSVSFRRRRARRRDSRLDYKEQGFPFLDAQKRLIREEGKQVLIDVERLIGQSSNKYGLALQLAEEANDFLRNNKEAALTHKPVFKAIANRINEGAGEIVTESYLDCIEDYSQYENLGKDDEKEK